MSGIFNKPFSYIDIKKIIWNYVDDPSNIVYLYSSYLDDKKYDLLDDFIIAGLDIILEKIISDNIEINLLNNILAYSNYHFEYKKIFQLTLCYNFNVYKVYLKNYWDLFIDESYSYYINNKKLFYNGFNFNDKMYNLCDEFILNLFINNERSDLIDFYYCEYSNYLAYSKYSKLVDSMSDLKKNIIKKKTLTWMEEWYDEKPNIIIFKSALRKLLTYNIDYEKKLSHYFYIDVPIYRFIY